jgi:hypothetical protein
MSQPPDRILFFGFRRPLNQESLKRALGNQRPAHVGLISRSNFLEGLTDDFYLARRGFRDYDFRANRFEAFPSGAFIEAMQHREPVAMRMYERAFRGIDTGQSIEVRKRLYLQNLAFAYGLLVDGRYQQVVFSEIPHHPFSYILHSTARQLGLATRFFSQIQVKDTYVVAPGIEEMFDGFAREYERAKQAPADVELAPHIQEEFERRTGEHKPFYMGTSDLNVGRRLYRWSKKHLRADNTLRLQRTLRNGAAYWRALDRVPQGPFVYFPLHLQPEATTSPMGGVYVDQFLAIETLSRSLPSGWSIAVKENPAQRYAKRDYGFYEQLAQTPNVHLVRRDTSTFDLIERCQAVATITGTAGWEALFKGKPALVFGRAFYRGAPGTIDATDPMTLARDLAEVEAGRFQPAVSAELRAFLGAIQRCSYMGVADTQYLRDSRLELDECIDLHAAVLEELLTGREPAWLADCGLP